MKQLNLKRNCAQAVSLERAGFSNRRHLHTDLSVAALGARIEYRQDADHDLVLCDITITRPAAVSRPQAGQGRLAVVSVDGRSLQHIGEDAGAVRDPAWSPYLTVR